MRHFGKIPAEALPDDVVRGRADHRLGKPAQYVGGIHNVCTRLLVGSILDHRRQPLCNRRNGFVCTNVHHPVAVLVYNIALQRMEQPVKPLVNCQVLGQRHRKLRIDDRNHREKRILCKVDLLVCFLVGDYAVRVRLRPCTCRCGNHHHRRRARHFLLLACAYTRIIPKVAVVLHHHCAGLCSINAAAPAQPDHKIATGLKRHFLCVHYAFFGGVGHDLVVHLVLHSIFGKELLYPIQDPHLFHNSIACDANQRFLARKLHLAQLIQPPVSKNHPCWYIKIYVKHCILSLSYTIHQYKRISQRGSAGTLPHPQAGRIPCRSSVRQS